ncbi:MAG TPA: diacylglycerol kinase family protein [Gaiellaceae bacterium]
MLATMKRAALIVNPFASGVTQGRLADVERELRGSLELTVALTERRGHAIELARAAADAEAIFVYGGDGLLNEVVNGVNGHVPLGVLPGGKTNVVARALGLPSEPRAAAQRLLAGSPRRISVGRVNGRRFAFAAGVGFDAELVRRVDRRGRRSDGRRPGDVAFVWEAMRLLASSRGRYEPTIELTGFGRAAFVLVANANPYSFAGRRALRVAPEASWELGLDLVAPQRVGPRTLPRLLALTFFGPGQRRPGDVFYGHDLDLIEVQCDLPLPLQADGEDLGDVERAVFEAERDAVTVLA